MRIHRCLVAALAAMLVAMAGCGDRRATVSGKVTFKDKSMPGGTVLFLSEDGTKSDSAEIKADGTYSSSNVPLGALRVAVLPVQKSAKDSMPKAAKGGGKMPDVPTDAPKAYQQGSTAYVDIPMALRDPTTSNITVTVNAGMQTFDIPLKDTK